MKDGRTFFLFNDTLSTLYLRLYGVGHMVKNHADNKRGTLLPRSYISRLKPWKIVKVKCQNEGRNERNVLFNDTLNTFYLRLYGVKHMEKDHSDNNRGNPLPPRGFTFSD